MEKRLEVEVKVGLFVTLGIGLIMVAILVLGGESFIARKSRFFTHFQAVDGMLPGAKVVIGGVQVGSVETVSFDPEKHDIRVGYAVARSSADWIRDGTEAEVATQGMLGDKYLSLVPGDFSKAPLPEGSEIPNRPGKDLTEFLSKGDQLMISLNSIAKSLDHLLKTFEEGNRSQTFFEGMAVTAKNLSVASEKLSQALAGGQLQGAVKNLNGILEKVNDGSGTLGALVNDPGLYDDVRALLGGVNRNRLVRNYIRQTIKDSEAAEAAQEKSEKKDKP